MIETSIREEILARLSSVTETKGVRILYAIESGSRAWGFPSRDSDYDVRFIYIHPTDWYLSIDSDVRMDVIEIPITDHIDLSGWDIRKALRLFAKSNPPLLEWLASQIIYYDLPIFSQTLRSLLPIYYAPNRCLHHYLHMAEGNYREYIKGDIVWIKKYFYILRPILAIRWIEQKRGPVPMLLSNLFVTIEENPDLIKAIKDLIHRKMQSEELDRGPAIPIIGEFIAEELYRIRNTNVDRDSKQITFEPLNNLFQSLLQT
jgi:uncharacterized protein